MRAGVVEKEFAQFLLQIDNRTVPHLKLENENIIELRNMISEDILSDTG